MGDIDIVIAQDRADVTNQAGDIIVAVNQQITIQVSIQIELVQSGQSQEVLAEDRSRGRAFSIFRFDRCRNQSGKRTSFG